MNAAKTFGMLGIILLCTLALVGAVAAIPVDITRVEIDDHKIDAGQTNRLDVMRDNKIDIELTLEATQDTDDIEVEAFVSGFEHNKDLRLSDNVGPFDMDANVTYRKNLQITLPELVKEDNYKLRVVVTNRDGQELIKNYNIKVDTERHNLKIVDASFTPSRHVQAGQALLSTVRVENFGEKDEKDVKVSMTIPALGLSSTDYIDEIKSDDEEETEEMYLRVPKCTKPGVYDMTIQVQYNDGFDRTNAEGQIEVLENPDCASKEEVTVQPATKDDGMAEAAPKTSKIRTALEIILLVLVGLLVVIGLIVGFSRMGSQD